jgi:hypothetical protein
VETRVQIPLGLPAETQDLRRRLHPSQGADTGLGNGHEPRSRGLASFNNLSRPAFVPRTNGKRHEWDPNVSDPEVPERELTPTEEDGETLCKLVLEPLPHDLGVIDAGNDPDALRK